MILSVATSEVGLEHTVNGISSPKSSQQRRVLQRDEELPNLSPPLEASSDGQRRCAGSDANDS